MQKTEQAIQRCVTISTVQKILGGKWKIEIIYYIGIQNIHRFGELRRHVGEITESSLTKKELFIQQHLNVVILNMPRNYWI